MVSSGSSSTGIGSAEVKLDLRRLAFGGGDWKDADAAEESSEAAAEG